MAVHMALGLTALRDPSMLPSRRVERHTLLVWGALWGRGQTLE